MIANLEQLDFAEICRSCMTKKQRMRPLFGSSLDAMLMAVANVKVTHNDGYPAQMCVQCVLQVSRAFTFKQQCEKTDATLKQYFDKMTPVEEVQNRTEVFMLEENSNEAKQHQSLQFVTLETTEQESEYQFNDNVSNECVLILTTVKQDQEIVEHQSDISSNYVISTVNALQEAIIQDDSCTGVYLHDGSAESLAAQEGEETSVAEDTKLIASFNLEPNVLDCGPIALDGEILGDDPYDADEVYDQNDEETLTEDDRKSALFLSDVLKCEDCNKEFKSNVELKAHKLSCPALTNVSPTNGTKELSQMTSSEQPPPYDISILNRFECQVCKKRFSDSSKLRRHSRTHLIDKPHVCKICGMSFAESSNLTKHNRKHTGELRNVVGKPNLCSVCGKRFKWATSLSKHMKHHTKRKLYFCPYPDCTKYYVEQRSLDIHVFSHDGKKPFTCSYCQKGFTQKCNLEKHERIHTGEKPFKCNICHKSFAQSGYLVIHQRIHSHEKPYNCEECGKQFAASHALTVHLRSHSGERPYACDSCCKRFSRQETLTIHKNRKHSNDKPHPCMLCPSKFLTTGNLTAHMKSNHGDRYYHMCPTCGKVFASMQSLKNHQKVHLKEGEMSEDQPQPMIQFVVDQEIVEQTMDLAAIEASNAINSSERL